VDIGTVGLLALAGVGAGLSGSIAGLASLASYPALLAVGLSPLTANVTNTVALIFASAGSISGSRPELRGQGPRVRSLALAGLLGGGAGGLLLLASPADTFELIVPWFIGIGSLTILWRRPAVHADSLRPDSRWLIPGVALIGVYGGYFGAAAGVLLLALLLVSTSETLAQCNAVKNVVLGLANALAAVLFIIFGSVDWAAAAPLAVGLFIGGRTGPIVVRHAPAHLLRGLIAVAGVGLAVYLGIKAYR
jgi:uncharacterized membrane protein YfcA